MQVQRVEIGDGWRTTITRPFSTSSSIFGMPRARALAKASMSPTEHGRSYKLR